VTILTSGSVTCRLTSAASSTCPHDTQFDSTSISHLSAHAIPFFSAHNRHNRSLVRISIQIISSITVNIIEASKTQNEQEIVNAEIALLQEWDVFLLERFRTDAESIDQADQELAARVQAMVDSACAALINAKHVLNEIGLYEMLQGQLSQVRCRVEKQERRAAYCQQKALAMKRLADEANSGALAETSGHGR